MYVCFRKQDSPDDFRTLFKIRRQRERQSHEALDRDARREDDRDCDLPVLASFAHLPKVTLDLRYHAS